MLRPDEQERRNRLIEDIRPALMRMAGRYRRKAGLPWQWREDHCHDLVIGAMHAFTRYNHLPDNQLQRIMVHAAHCDFKDRMRQAVGQALAMPPIQRTDQIDLIAARDDAASATAAFEFAEWFTVVAKAAGLTRQELIALLGVMQGRTVAEIAETITVSCRTVDFRLSSARSKIAPHVARFFAGFRYTVSPRVPHATGDAAHDDN